MKGPKGKADNFVGQQFLEKEVEPAKHDGAVFNQKSAKLGKHLEIHVKENTKGAFLDTEGREVWEEIISHKVSKEHKIVQEALKVKLKRKILGNCNTQNGPASKQDQGIQQNKEN